MLNTMNDKEKLEALKSQIRFRKNILHQSTDDKKILNFSKTVNNKRKELAWKEMSENINFFYKRIIYFAGRGSVE